MSPETPHLPEPPLVPGPQSPPGPQPLMGPQCLLRMTGAGRTFRSGGDRIDAVVDAALEIESGEIVTIGGPSGSGKSTLLMMAAAMLTPTAGHVELFGRDLGQLTLAEATRWRAGRLGLVLPLFDLVPYLSALDNVRLAADGPDADDRAAEMLKRFGLAPRLRHVPSRLSAGEQRRLLVARGLVNEPEFILCDEPTANLDDENADRIRQQLIRERSRGAALLVVTHEPGELFRADRRRWMRAGHLLQQPPTKGDHDGYRPELLET